MCQRVLAFCEKNANLKVPDIDNLTDDDSFILNQYSKHYNDLINYSKLLYRDQELKLTNESLHKELIDFFLDRLKYYMKEKKIRMDIIEASINSYETGNFNRIYKKAFALNNIIDKEIGKDIILSYKRASNILDSELKDKKLELSKTADPGIFKNEFEKNLYKKIDELKKYFVRISNDENFDETLMMLSTAKKEIFDFFENVKVNDENDIIKKNRLELINILCKTFENYTYFQLIEDINE